ADGAALRGMPPQPREGGPGCQAPPPAGPILERKDLGRPPEQELRDQRGPQTPRGGTASYSTAHVQIHSPGSRQSCAGCNKEVDADSIDSPGLRGRRVTLGTWQHCRPPDTGTV